MAYAVKYILQFTSDRGNEIRIEVLKKDYQGEVIYKSLGGSPSLSIEQGDGAIKGSSLVFTMQADIEGELQELYTTDNKQFKVNMYRNEVLTWQGYILPELYSEEYVDAPYDVSVTATDQLATLKAITYQREDVNVSLSTIIEDILSFTQISVPVTYHQNLSALRKGEVPMLVDSHISQAAYNGYSCYDVLNNILLSCNCCIMQINGEWLISSLTNSTTNYYTAGVSQVREHKVLGQLGVGEVCPAGTLTMVNNPALKGARVEYAHMLRHSFLANADCVDREGWNYTPDSRNPIDIPGEREAFGKIFKTYCWELHPVNIREDNSLQLWQEVALEKDERNYYDLSVKTLFSTDAKLLLMAVTYLGSDGVERRLTSEGWIEKWDKSDVNYYIQITGTNKNAGLDAIADIEQYEMSTVQFALPPVDGTMRVGFINSTTDYAEPLASAPIYVSQVYLTVSGVTGQECTTEVEPNATQEQQGVLLAYGDTFESENAYKLGLNTLKKSSGENITSWWLDNVNYSSYYDTMLQEFSRYFGVKKAQLQGIIMGKDVLSDMYADVFSGRVMRLLTAQVDLLADEASVTVEEVITTTVDFNTVIYATNNTNSFGSSSGGGSGTSGGSSSTAGESLLGVQSDGDVYVKDGRALVGQEGRFENLALPVDSPTERKETRTYLYSSDPSKGAIDIAKIAKWIDEQEEMWVLDAENGVIKTTYNVVSEQEIISGRRASGSGSGGGGGITEITAEMITDALGYVPYSSLNPAGYITSAALNGYAKTSDIPSLSGYATETWVSNNYQPKGNYLTSVSWDIVSGKPTTLGGYGITDFIVETTSSLNNTTAKAGIYRLGGTAPDNHGYGNAITLRYPTTDTFGQLYIPYNMNLPKGGVYWRGSTTDSTAQSWRLMLDESNYSSYALPLSGGVMQGNIDISNHRIKLGYSVIEMGGGMLGTYNPNEPITLYWYDTTDWRQIIHEGNIGSQSVNYASRAGLVGYSSVANLTHTALQYWFDWGENSITGYGGAYKYGLHIGSPDPNYSFQVGMSTAYNGLYGRFKNAGTWGSWREIAFTNSDITGNAASATKLQTVQYLWGQPFDGTNGVNGQISINFDSNSFYIEPSVGGTGMAGISWWRNGFTRGVIDAAPLCLNSVSEGNVLIGTTANSGYKLDVNGPARFGSNAFSDLSNVPFIVSNAGYYNWNAYVGDTSGGILIGYKDGIGQIGVDNNRNLAILPDGGNILIGTRTDSGYKFYLKDTTTNSNAIYLESTNGNGEASILYYASRTGVTWAAGIACGLAGQDVWSMYSVSAGKWIFAAKTTGVDINGNLTATGEVISSRRASSSDARLKDNINRLIAEDCLAMVRDLQPSSWRWKEDGKFSLGFIAQDIEPLMPYAVIKIKDDVLGQRLNLQYDQFFAPVVGAIQCLDIKVNSHEDEIESLKNEVAELKQKLSKYETVWQ